MAAVASEPLCAGLSIAGGPNRRKDRCFAIGKPSSCKRMCFLTWFFSFFFQHVARGYLQERFRLLSPGVQDLFEMCRLNPTQGFQSGREMVGGAGRVNKAS